jgi:hypothetical protein
MARPQAEILLTTNQTDTLTTDVMAAQGLWAVLYKDKPVNVRNRYWTDRGETIKYTKSVYPYSAPAKNLAEKLNAMYYTEDFTVVKIL